MAVIFNSFDVIEIDGIVAGNIVDVISNHAPKRAEVLAAFNVYVAALQTEINAAKVELQADKTQLTTDLAAKTTAYDAEVAKVTALEAEKATLTTEKATLTTELATLQAKVTTLEAIRQFNPRWTTPDYFINRFTAKEAKAFYSSEDAMIVGGQQLLEAYEAAGWYVDLDDTQVQGLTGYMVQLGMMTPERRAQVLRDVTAQEAWYPQ